MDQACSDATQTFICMAWVTGWGTSSVSAGVMGKICKQKFAEQYTTAEEIPKTMWDFTPEKAEDGRSPERGIGSGQDIYASEGGPESPRHG